MNSTELEFEYTLHELERKIQELKSKPNAHERAIQKQLHKLQEKHDKMLQHSVKNLSAWEISKLARHKERPSTLDYIQLIFTDFDELHGDRFFKEDSAMVGGLAKLNKMPVVVLGQERGKSLQDKIDRNFGMSSPEGYRKAMRLMKMAEKFGLPVISFIDTGGAYPGIGAEERGQSAAIAENLALLSHLKTPVISCIIGQGGSGGALAIGVADRVLMLQYSIYSVISPEGCASILWHTSEKADVAAEAMGITADKIKQLGLIDEVVPEPLGGAHRDQAQAAQLLKDRLQANLEELQNLDLDTLLNLRYEKIMAYSALD